MELALPSLFPELDADSIAAVLASTDGVFSLEALEGLLAMHAEVAGHGGAPTDPRFGDAIRFVGDVDWAAAAVAAASAPLASPATAPPRWIVIQSFPPASSLSLAQRAPLELLVGQIVCVLPAAEGDSLRIRRAVSSFHSSSSVAAGAAALPSSNAALALPPVYADSLHAGGVFVVKDAGLLAIAAPSASSSAQTAASSDADPFSRAAVFYAVTPAHRAARALDQLFDSFFWGWSLPPAASVSEQFDAPSADSATASAALADSVGWTSRLEFSLVELLVSVDEVLLPMLEGMRRMVPQESSEMAEMSTLLRKYLHEALDARDAHAIGGIHQTLHQIMELDVPGMPVQMVPPQFAAHVRAFEAAKCEAMPPPALARLRAAIDEAATALRQYAASLTALEAERRELHAQQMALYYSQQQHQQQQFQYQQYRMPYQMAPPPAQPQSLRADIDSYAVSCARLEAISAGMQRLMESRTRCNTTESSSASSSTSASSPPSASAHPSVAIEWHFLAQLKAKKIGDLLATMMGGGAGAALEPRVLASLPDIPMHCVGDPDVRVLDRYLDCLALNCVGGAALLGGVLAGFKLDAHTPGEHGEILLRNVLRAGCGFVGSGGGRVIALVNQRRAQNSVSRLLLQSLPLLHIPHAEARKLAVRLKDVARILRTKINKPLSQAPENARSSGESLDVSASSASTFASAMSSAALLLPAAPLSPLLPPRRLALRLSTDFSAVMHGVHAHHSPSWVSPELERIWHFMFARGTMVTFELWLRTPVAAPVPEPVPASVPAPVSAPSVKSETATETVGASALSKEEAVSGSVPAAPAAAAQAAATYRWVDELIAADVGFPMGRSMYIATRFASRSHKTLAPGFMLSFSSTRVLREAGFALWDLGGTDSSPMMAYKREVAIEQPRTLALQRFREIRAIPGAPQSLPIGTELVSALTSDHLLNVDAWAASTPPSAASALSCKANGGALSASAAVKPKRAAGPRGGSQRPG